MNYFGTFSKNFNVLSDDKLRVSEGDLDTLSQIHGIRTFYSLVVYRQIVTNCVFSLGSLLSTSCLDLEGDLLKETREKKYELADIFNRLKNGETLLAIRALEKESNDTTKNQDISDGLKDILKLEEVNNKLVEILARIEEKPFGDIRDQTQKMKGYVTEMNRVGNLSVIK